MGDVATLIFVHCTPLVELKFLFMFFFDGYFNVGTIKEFYTKDWEL
jgi:hypothetical protein